MRNDFFLGEWFHFPWFMFYDKAEIYFHVFLFNCHCLNCHPRGGGDPVYIVLIILTDLI